MEYDYESEALDIAQNTETNIYDDSSYDGAEYAVDDFGERIFSSVKDDDYMIDDPATPDAKTPIENMDAAPSPDPEAGFGEAIRPDKIAADAEQPQAMEPTEDYDLADGPVDSEES